MNATIPITSAKASSLVSISNATKVKGKTVALTMTEVLARIAARTDGWPRRVGGALFVASGSEIAWLDSTASVFGWLASETGAIEWKKCIGGVTKEETYHEMRRTAPRYKSVEQLPHEPPMEDHYYACGDVAPGDGSALNGFLDRFSPDTPIDRDLIVAAMATPLWGGPGGSRPAFMFTSDFGTGVGKSTVPKMIGQIFGGAVDVAKGEDISQIKARLLSPDSLAKRVAVLDNLKTLKLSWAELEALVTAPEISGKRMYVGEATRPNTITWFLTLNGANMSRDMAQRCVTIKLAKPSYSGAWESETNEFIATHRKAIIADLIGWLRGPAATLDKFTRWASWEKAVLSRLPEPADTQKVIEERQAVVDVEAEEAEILEEAFARQLKRLGYAPESCHVHLPSEVAAVWYNLATNDRLRVAAVSRVLKQLCNESRLKCLSINKCKAYGRGFVWTGKEAPLDAQINLGVRDRIAARVAESSQKGGSDGGFEEGV